jgi:hypothetical protein
MIDAARYKAKAGLIWVMNLAKRRKRKIDRGKLRLGGIRPT